MRGREIGESVPCKACHWAEKHDNELEKEEERQIRKIFQESLFGCCNKTEGCRRGIIRRIGVRIPAESLYSAQTLDSQGPHRCVVQARKKKMNRKIDFSLIRTTYRLFGPDTYSNGGN